MLSLENTLAGCRTERSPDFLRRKRVLPIIEESVDSEDVVPTRDTINTKNVLHAVSGKTAQADGKEGEPEVPVNSTKKTRRKAIILPNHPSLSLLQCNRTVDPSDRVPEVDEHSSETENWTNRIDSGTEGDLTRLKDTATKLNLKTRRQSYLTWRAKYVDKSADPPEVVVAPDCDGKLTSERKERMEKALDWIRSQLIDLRRQDQSLARQLLGIRHELSSLRLAASCEEHKELLDDAQEQMEELRELSRFADFPPEMLEMPLRQIGVTKMNLSSRRFSTC